MDHLNKKPQEDALYYGISEYLKALYGDTVCKHNVENKFDVKIFSINK